MRAIATDVVTWRGLCGCVFGAIMNLAKTDQQINMLFGTQTCVSSRQREGVLEWALEGAWILHTGAL